LEAGLALIPPLPKATIINNDAALGKLVQSLSTEALLAVDTESNNMYAYEGRTCLIQLSTREADYIIDPLPIKDMQPLGEIFSNPKIEKIFHAAEYDLICMKRDFNFEIRKLFDTMYAARLCNAIQFGLADLLLEHFGIEVDKSHQLDNWGQRPLPKASLLYAQMDTHYLPALRDILMEELKALGRLEEAYEVFEDVLRIDVKEKEFDPDGFWKIGRPRALSRRQMAVLRELYLLRDKIAQEEDVPPFKAISNPVLVSLAKEQPRNHNELHRIKSLNGHDIRVYGERLLAAIEKGRVAPLPSQPARDNPDSDIAERYTVLHSWRRDVAAERGIDSSLILSKNTLWEIARLLPVDKEALASIEGMGRWRLETYGEALLKIIRTLS
jgi:ribonuclease D